MASVLSPLTSLTTGFGCRDTQSNACGDLLLPLLGSPDLGHDLVRCVREVADGVLGQALLLLRLQGVAHQCCVWGEAVAVHGPHVDDPGVILATGGVQVGPTLWSWSWVSGDPGSNPQ